MLIISDGLEGRCAILTLDRPKALNALNGELLDAFDAALDAVEADEGKRAVIIAGKGRAFCAGADLKESGIDAIARVERIHTLMLRLLDFPKIIVAAIDGFALGGGLELAMACSFRVASPASALGLPEIRMNLIPGYGGTQMLPRLIGAARAVEMILDGQPISAARALEIGLITAMSAEGEPVLDAALALAARYSRHGPEAQHAARRAIWRGAGLSIEDGLRLERELVSEVARSKAAQAGVASFRETGRN
nr:enoyl-CoA hydratase/isomerase family protein [Sphingomonas sp. Y57]